MHGRLRDVQPPPLAIIESEPILTRSRSPTSTADAFMIHIKATVTESHTFRTGLGIEVPKGAAKPEIASVDALKRTLLNAKSVGYEAESQPASQFLEVLERLGIAQEMRPQLKAVTSMQEALAKREVEMTVSSMAATLGNPAADFVGAFPREGRCGRDHKGARGGKGVAESSNVAERHVGIQSQGL